jgi:hypothetical protein
MLFSSSDIQVGALVGDATTNSIALVAKELNGRSAIIGGNTQGPGYTLTAAEALRFEGRGSASR